MFSQFHCLHTFSYIFMFFGSLCFPNLSFFQRIRTGLLAFAVIHVIVQKTVFCRLLDFSWRQCPSWDLERLLLAQLLIWLGHNIFCNAVLVFKKVSFQVHMFFFSFSPLHTASWLMMMILLFGHLAEDWLNPAAVVEAFEARALRMAVACAKNLSKFENQEQGKLF